MKNPTEIHRCLMFLRTATVQGSGRLRSEDGWSHGVVTRVEGDAVTMYRNTKRTCMKHVKERSMYMVPD